MGTGNKLQVFHVKSTQIEEASVRHASVVAPRTRCRLALLDDKSAGADHPPRYGAK